MKLTDFDAFDEFATLGDVGDACNDVASDVVNESLDRLTCREWLRVRPYVNKAFEDVLNENEWHAIKACIEQAFEAGVKFTKDAWLKCRNEYDLRVIEQLQ